MEHGKNTFTIEYASGKIKEFEKKILTQNICSSFLPMSFVGVGKTERANYDCSGYQSLENYAFANSKEMIEIFEKCVFALIHSFSFLMSPRKYELALKTVFYSAGKKEMRFAYIPKETPKEKAVFAFLEFLESVESHINQKNSGDDKNEMLKYLKEIKLSIENSNRSLIDIVNYLGEIKREIYACE